MMIFTHSDFERDLSHFKVSFQINNSWFEESLFSLISFPIDLPIEGFFEKYRYHNEEEYEAKLDGVLNWKGKLSKAQMQIMDIADNYIRVTIESGLDAFPNWDKKLSELPLENRTVSNIRDHANSILDKTWPEVNYNFPMVHAPKYDKSNSLWTAFEGIYNKRVSGVFVENEVDEPNNIIYNRNIMRPFPSIMHVLKVGVNSAGFELKGDILNDSDFLKINLVPPGIIEKKDRPESVEWLVSSGDYTRLGFRHRLGGGWQYGEWKADQEINIYGKFRLKGIIHNWDRKHLDTHAKISLDGRIIWENSGRRSYNLDLVFTTKKEGSILNLYAKDYHRDSEKAELELIPMELYDENGNEIDFNTDSNIIDLRFHVPDCSFSDLVNYIRMQKNYSFDLINGNEIHMNIKEVDVLPTNAINLEAFEVQLPSRSLNTIDSYLVRYKDFDSDVYPNQEVFFNNDGIKMTDYKVNDDTVELEINGIPLPIETVNNVTTANLFTDDSTAICVVRYDGLLNGQNATQKLDNFSLPQIIDSFYRKWLYFQLNTIMYSWKFSKYVNDSVNFEITDKIFAYKNYHFIKEMSITRISPMEEEFDLKTYIIRPKLNVN